MKIGSLTINPAVIISCIVIIGLVVLFFAILKKLFGKYTSPKADIAKEKKTVMKMLYSILRFVIILIAILTILQINGVNISAAVTSLGIVGAVGALAVQDLLKDFIMGVNIVTDHYFHVDDVVDFKGYIGKVVEIGMRCTKIQSIADGSIKTVENHCINEITVLSHQISIEVSLPYELKMGDAYALMEKINKRISEIPEVESSEFKGTQLFDQSSIKYLQCLFCPPEIRLPIRRKALHIIQEETELAGISMPYPQLDVHMPNQ